jgi:hypothetical protein
VILPQKDMILNSTFVLNAPADDPDGVEALFDGDVAKAYDVFSYLMLWIHWKVQDPFYSDERYFRTYFNDYSRSDRCLFSGTLNVLSTH